MRAISTVIGSILILMIVIALGGTSYLYISGIFTGKISNAFSIGYSAGDTITIRNDGTDPITSFRSVKIDGNDAVYSVSKQDSSLVGYWKMDELDRITSTDSSGKGNTGTFTGEIFNDGTINGATFTPGQYGSALSFDGVNDYVNLGDPADGSLDPQEITISAWIKTTQTSTGRIVWKWAGDTSGSYLLSLGDVTAGRIRFIIRNSSAGYTILDSAITVNDNNWHYVTGTYDKTAGKIRLYIDGILDREGNLIGSIQASTNGVTISAESTPFNGIMDEVKIYNRALSQAEIQEDMNSPYPVDRTVAWYNFENDAKDRHNIVKGRYGPAFSFDGVNDYGETVNTVLFTTEFTMEAWFNSNEWAAWPTDYAMDILVSKWERGPGNIDVGYIFGRTYGGDFGIWVSSGVAMSAVSASIPISTISTGIWHHAVATFRGGSFIGLYIDGVKVAESTAGIYSQVTDAQNDAHRIGMFSDNYGIFNGTIDEVKIYNRALSEQEIKASYNIGSQINAGQIATIKIYNQLSKGTHTVRICTSSMCTIALLTIT